MYYTLPIKYFKYQVQVGAQAIKIQHLVMFN